MTPPPADTPSSHQRAAGHRAAVSQERDVDPVADMGAGRGPTWLDEALAAELPGLIALRRQIHARPEIAWTEHETTAAVRAALDEVGIASSLLPAGTGLVAEIGSGGEPVIALRADMDALPIAEESGLPFASAIPGVSHACGHDVHTAVLVGAARVLARARKLAGTVRLIFQAAEEVMPGGAHDVVAAGALDGVAHTFALHCDPGLEVGRVGTRVGAITSACDLVQVTVRGPGGHTSRPHLTVDVVGAVAAVADRLPGLVARHLPPQAEPTLVWGSIAAGDASNVIPRTGRLTGTLRLAEREAWRGAEPLVRGLVEQIAAPFRAEVTVDYQQGVPPVVNDPGAVAILRAAVTAGLGREHLAESEQSSGGEDFGIMTDVVPGALARLGVWDGIGPQVDLHSATFRADERAIAVGVRTLAHLVLAATRS